MTIQSGTGGPRSLADLLPETMAGRWAVSGCSLGLAAQRWPRSTGRPRKAGIRAPGTGNSHRNLSCYLGPGLAFVAQLQAAGRAGRTSTGGPPKPKAAGTVQ
jgi:hypothetical protein